MLSAETASVMLVVCLLLGLLPLNLPFPGKAVKVAAVVVVVVIVGAGVVVVVVVVGTNEVVIGRLVAMK